MKKPYSSLIPALLLMACLIIINSPLQAIVYQQWSQFSPGPQHRLDPSCGVGVDSSGNVYVADPFWGIGWAWCDFAVSKYSPEGTMLWRSFYHNSANGYAVPSAMAVDVSGNVYVTGDLQNYPNDDFITVKFNTQGQQVWAATYNWQGNSDDRATVVTTDNLGNVYVSGHSYVDTSPGDYRFSTVKYNSQGVQQWVAQYHVPYFNMGGEVVDMGVDPQGNVVLTGYCYIALPTERDYITIKYDSQGQQLWLAVYNGPTNHEDEPVDLALDNLGNVFVTGESVGDVNNDVLTIKYNSQGVQQWVARYDDSQHHAQWGTSLAVDTDGNVIVAATESPAYDAYLVLKYDGDGLQQWVRYYSAKESYSAKYVIVDGDRNIYVTGSAWTTYENNYDCHTLKLDSAGDVKWIADNDFNHRGEAGSYMTLDRQGDLAISGSFWWPDQGDGHFLLIKYHQTPGDLGAVMNPTTPPVEIPAQGGSFSYNLVMVNSVAPNLTTDIWWKVKYPGSTWVPTQLAGPITMTLPLDTLSTLRTQRVPGNAPAGTYQYIICAGDYPSAIWGTDTILVTKLTTGSGPLVEGWDNVEGNLSNLGGMICPSVFTLYPASPNPFNPVTTIRFVLPEAGQTVLNVYDISGCQVAQLINGPCDAGQHEVTFDGRNLCSGIYLYTLTAGQYTTSGKMALLK